MRATTLTGSRIRERRTILGIKQADLARRAGVSPSYLNLIEHNRRKIAGKLLNDIADALDVEPAILSQGAEAALVAGLREAAGVQESDAELDRIEEFAGRFPGWAKLISETSARIAEYETTVQALSDRLTHDPHLAASLHEMLTMVTAIRSTASILAEPGDISPEWQARFHRNINEDSARLAETSQALVAYLDTLDDASSQATSPQDEADGVLAEHAFHFPSIEAGEEGPDEIGERLGNTLSASARTIFETVLARYAEDAAQLPLEDLEAGVAEFGIDPVALSHHFREAPDRILRRLATLPAKGTRPSMGLAVCDRSGAMIFRKPLDAFPLPRHGAACTLLPLYAALHRPGVMVSELLEQPGQTAPEFVSYAFAAQTGPAPLNRVPLYQSHMLIVPVTAERPPLPLARIGVSCRICPRGGCPGRREPSLLAEERGL